jgi:hypothetical protein
MKRQRCWHTCQPLSLLLECFQITLVWGVMIRLHVCHVHTVIGVEDGEREHAYNAQGHRRCIIVVDAWTCGYAAKF